MKNSSIPAKWKSAIRFIILFMALNAITSIKPQKAEAQVSVSFQLFYDHLSPYGNWINNPSYGYCWVPRVSRGFTPYGTNGYWVYTNAGWAWVSNYSWGWAPFHYGRWFYDDFYGWVWVPDNEWAPAWVSWRRTNDYYGWAPISPGLSIEIAYNSVPYDRWRFVRCRDFGRANISNYYVSTSSNTTIINNSTVINNYRVVDSRARYDAGPQKAEVEKRAGKTFNEVAVRESNKPGEHLAKNELQIYKPQVQKNNNAGNKPAPAKVMGWKTNQAEKQQPAQQKPEQPIKQQPVQQKPIQPIKQEPIKQQPVQQKPVQPIKQEPIKQQAVQQKPIQPIKQEPIKQQPVQQKPVQPIKQEPVKQQPVQQKPVQPIKQEPVKQQPVQQKPVQPIKQEPVKQQPVQQKPVQPIKQEPIKQQPVQQSPKPQKENPPRKKNG